MFVQFHLPGLDAVTGLNFERVGCDERPTFGKCRRDGFIL
jgi:hypothetical protein